MESLKKLSLMEKVGAFVLGFIVLGIIFYGVRSLSRGYLINPLEFFLSWGMWLIILLVASAILYLLIIKFKKWKIWPIWLKSGVICVGIYLLISIIFLLLKNVHKKYWEIPFIPVAYLIRYGFGGGPHNDILNISLIIIISALIVFFVGAIIGLIVDKIKSK